MTDEKKITPEEQVPQEQVPAEAAVAVAEAAEQPPTQVQDAPVVSEAEQVVGEVAEKAPADAQPPEKKLFWKELWFWAVIAVILLAIAVSVSGTKTLDMSAQAASDFLESGEITLTGFGNLTLEEIEEGLSFIPKTDFTVSKKTTKTVLITLDKVRDTGYELEFFADVKAKDGKTERYTYDTVINGPVSTAFYTGRTTIDSYSALQIQFSQQVDVDSFEKNFSISPKTHYTIEYNKTSVTIWPDDEWQAGLRYTATLGEGYTATTGKQLSEKLTFGFGIYAPAQSVPASPTINYLSNRTYILNAQKDMTLIFQADSLKSDVPIVVETYRVPTLEKYYQQSHIYLNYDVPLDILEKVDSNVFLVKNGENLLNLPHPGEGTYIVSVKYTHPRTKEEIEDRTGYLVTPVSVYMQASSRDTLVWVNSGATGEALAGHSIYFGDAKEPLGTTAADGTILITEREKNEYYSDQQSPNDFRLYAPDGTLVYYDMGVGEYGFHKERYYSYLFLDRTLYRPEDVVSFWGFVQPYRTNQMEMPSSVTVTFDPDGLNMEQEVPLSPDGVFHGEFALERIKSSQYVVEATLVFPVENSEENPEVNLEENPEEGKIRHTFETEYLSVKEFEKPSYVLDSIVDNTYYGPYDQVEVTAKASFYDGTPLPFFPVELSYYSQGEGWVPLGTRETDELGNITFEFPAWDAQIRTDASPQTGRYKVAIESDGESITHMGAYTVFPSDVLVESSMNRSGNNLSLTVHTYKLDLQSEQLKAAMSGESNYDYYYGYYGLSNERLLQIARGEPVDVSDMSASLRWDYYDTRGIRHRYIYNYNKWDGPTIYFANTYSLDYIVKNNPNIKIVENPNTNEKVVTFSTVNGAATITDLIYLDEGRTIDFDRSAYCRTTITFEDGKKNDRTSYAYYPNESGYREDWSAEEEKEKEKPIIPGFSFEVQNLTTNEDITPSNSAYNDYGPGYYYYYNSISVNIGDKVRFKLLEDSMPTDGRGRILYSLIQDGVLERRIVSGDTFDLNIGMQHGMNCKLVAVYFDGTGVRIINQIDINVKASSMELNIDVTPNKDSYRPGETVSLNVNVTDSRGNGVAGNLCVAVVDEAIFALSEQYIEVLSDLYGELRYLDNSVRQYFTTYRDELPDRWMGDGGKGDGGGVDFYDSYRSNFKDTALFFPTKTNAAGNATITFDLPDNTTSWRITAVEVGANLMGGQSKSNIISTLPFFCKPVLTSKYIDGDDFAMLVQGHGTLLDTDSEIEYTVTVRGDDYEETLTASGKAFTAQEINFGKLPIGSYTVISKAQYSGYSDTVERQVDVIKSNLELVVHKELDLSKPIDIEAMRYPVTITFYNKDAEPFVATINSLFGHYCMQTSQRLSRVIAKQALRYSMPGQTIPSYIADTSENIADMQNTDGGIGHALNTKSDPLLTTYVLLVAPDQFNKKSMTDYYTYELKKLKDEKDIAACYLGLAVLEQVDAKKIREQLESSERLDVKAYYIAALAVLGETEEAGKLYNELCKPHVAKRTITRTDEKETEWERDAAACWIAASLLHYEDADMLSLHFGSYAWRYRTLYEGMIYVSNYQGILKPAAFRYSAKGETKDVSLQFAESSGYYNRYDTSYLMRAISLSKSELESFKLLDYTDNLSAVAYYIGEPSEIGIKQSENMSMTKSIKELDNSTYEITLTIRFKENAPTGTYDLSDWIPSNTRLYDYDKSYLSNGSTNSFAVRQENQNLYVSFNRKQEKAQTVIFKYRVRKTFTSEAALDTAYLIHGDSGENCNTEKGTFSTKQPETVKE